MIATIVEILEKWNGTTDSRQKIQHAYAVGGIIILVVAGLISLVNYDLGQSLLSVSLIAIAIFFINAVVWALLTSFVLLRLKSSGQKPARPRTRK